MFIGKRTLQRGLKFIVNGSYCEYSRTRNVGCARPVDLKLCIIKFCYTNSGNLLEVYVQAINALSRGIGTPGHFRFAIV